MHIEELRRLPGFREAGARRLGRLVGAGVLERAGRARYRLADRSHLEAAVADREEFAPAGRGS